jgi:hypothetical protein
MLMKPSLSPDPYRVGSGVRGTPFKSQINVLREATGIRLANTIARPGTGVMPETDWHSMS